MFPVSVRMDEEHVESLEMALAALNAERAVFEKWGTFSNRLTLAIDDLQEITKRAREAARLGDKQGMTTVIGRMKPW